MKIVLSSSDDAKQDIGRGNLFTPNHRHHHHPNDNLLKWKVSFNYQRKDRLSLEINSLWIALFFIESIPIVIVLSLSRTLSSLSLSLTSALSHSLLIMTAIYTEQRVQHKRSVLGILKLLLTKNWRERKRVVRRVSDYEKLHILKVLFVLNHAVTDHLNVCRISMPLCT